LKGTNADFVGNHLLNFLASHTDLQGYVIAAVLQAITKITKLSWFDEKPADPSSDTMVGDGTTKVYPHHDIVDVTTNFLKVCCWQKLDSIANIHSIPILRLTTSTLA
jgi:hypothetical protein